jgi:lipopolysaccharide export system protein LptC
MKPALLGSARRGASMPSRRLGLPAFAGAARPVDTVTAVDRRHTRRVAILKRVLPATGVSLLLLIAIWPRLEPLWERMRVSFPAIDLRDARELRMVNPRFSGIDREGRPFVVVADSARQIPDRQDLVSLQTPVAELTLRSGAHIHTTSVSAVYQSQANVIDMFGDVTITHQDGTRFVTRTARVNAAQNAAEGNDPVAGHGPAGDVKAQGFRILDKGDEIIFTGQADMLLNGARKVAATRTPPALPAQVAELAAQTEAAVRPVPAVYRREVSHRETAGGAAAKAGAHAPAHASSHASSHPGPHPGHTVTKKP